MKNSKSPLMLPGVNGQNGSNGSNGTVAGCSEGDMLLQVNTCQGASGALSRFFRVRSPEFKLKHTVQIAACVVLLVRVKRKKEKKKEVPSCETSEAEVPLIL